MSSRTPSSPSGRGATGGRPTRPGQGAGPRRGRRDPRVLRAVVPLLVGAGVGALLALVWSVPAWVPVVYLGMSLLTGVVYAVDKSAARRQAWRVQESTLHLLALLGGWPGAVVAQQVLRHKTVKASFRATFWVTVVVNLLLLVAICSPAGARLVESLGAAAG